MPALLIKVRQLLAHGRARDGMAVMTIAGWVGAMILPALWRLRNAIPPLGGDPDGRVSMSFDHAVSDAFHRFGEFAEWNPYLGGGVPWSGFIYNGGLSIVGLFDVWFGPIVAPKVMIAFVLFVAGIGTYGAVRRWLKCNRLVSLYAALAYVAAHWLPCQILSGNYSMMMAFTAPAFAWLFHALLERRWWGLLLPILIQTSFAKAKYAPFIMGGMLLVLVFFWAGLNWRRIAEGLTVWLLAFAAGTLMAMPKLLPLLRMYRMDLVEQSDFGGHVAYRTWSELVQHLGPFGPGMTANHTIGTTWMVVLLAAVAVGYAPKRALPFVVLTALGFFTTLGWSSPVPTVHIIRRLPILDSLLSYPKYFNTIPALGIIGLSALGIEFVWKLTATHVHGRKAQIAAGLVIAFLLSWSLVQHGRQTRSLYPGGFKVFPERIALEEGDFFHIAHQKFLGGIDRYRLIDNEFRSPYNEQFINVLSGIGVLTWYGNFVLPENAIPRYIFDENSVLENPAYQGEFGVNGLPNEPARIDDYTFTYNTISFQALPGPERTIVINFNYDEGWSATTGPVYNLRGRLGVRLAEGYEGPVQLRYRDPGLRLGIGLAIPALIGWFIGFPLARRRLSRQFGLDPAEQETPAGG